MPNEADLSTESFSGGGEVVGSPVGVGNVDPHFPAVVPGGSGYGLGRRKGEGLSLNS